MSVPRIDNGNSTVAAEPQATCSAETEAKLRISLLFRRSRMDSKRRDMGTAYHRDPHQMWSTRVTRVVVESD
jgi:hypothetical protein